MPPATKDDVVLCVRRETGEIWQRPTSQEELQHLRSLPELKAFLAALEPRSPPPTLVVLQRICRTDGLVELEDDEDIPWSSLLFKLGTDFEGVGVPEPLHYHVKEVEILGYLKSKGLWMTLPDDSWPKVEGVQLAFKMFEPCVSLLLTHIRTSLGMQVYHEFMLLWRYVILNLPGHIIDARDADGTTLLCAMMQFLKVADCAGLESIVQELVETRTLDSEVINSVVFDRKRQLSIPLVWYCASLKPMIRPSGPQLVERRPHAEIGLTLLSRYEVSPEIWDLTLFGGCTLLQFLLQTPPKEEACQKTDAEAKLCAVLAKRFNFEQLCRQDHRGLCALTYAEQLLSDLGSSAQGGPWSQVLETIKERMIAGARSHEGQLKELIVVLHQLQDAHDVSQADPGGPWPGSELRGVIDAVESIVFRLAVDIRKNWMKTGRTPKVGRYHRHVLDRRRSSY